MTMLYPIVLETEENGAVSAYVPGLPVYAAADSHAKAERATQGAQGPEMGTADDAGAPVGQWEWFSASRGRVMATEPNQRPTADGVDDWVLLTDAGEEPQP